MLFIGLRGQPVFQLSRATYRALALILCSAVLMGGVLVFLEAATRHWTTAADKWTQIGGLAFLVMMGAGVYALLCQYFGILSMRSLSDALRRKP